MTDTIVLGVIPAGTVVTKELVQQMVEDHQARPRQLIELPVFEPETVAALVKAGRTGNLTSNA